MNAKNSKGFLKSRRMVVASIFGAIVLLLTSVFFFQVKAYGQVSLDDFVSPVLGDSYHGTCAYQASCSPNHTGFDICNLPGCGYDASGQANPSGPNVYAAAAGVVVDQGYDADGYGNYLVIEHLLNTGNKVYTLYGHLAQINVANTEEVTASTLIGVMGMSGAGGNGIVHLHFEFKNALWGGYENPTFIVDRHRTYISETPTASPSLPDPTPSLIITPINTIVPTTPPIIPGGTINPVTPLSDPNNFKLDESAYYYNLPDNYNMDSCEKVVVNNEGVDEINKNIPISSCSRGLSDKNNKIICGEDWVVAYVETIAVNNFPLLQFLSATEPTNENNITPICYADVNLNISNSYANYVPLNFSNDYSGLLRFTGTRGTVDIKYPRLGTATSCAVVDFRDVKHPLYLDIQSFNIKFPKIVGEKSGNVTENDNWLIKLINFIKENNIFNLSLKDKESKHIKTVADILNETETKKGVSEVCGDLPGNPIVKVNISDATKPLENNSKFVVNQLEEIKFMDHTKLCDMQYQDGSVIDAGCKMNNGEVFDQPADTSVTKYPNGPYFTTKKDSSGNEITECVNHITICGATFDCNHTVADLYNQCRKNDTVSSAWGLASCNISTSKYDLECIKQYGIKKFPRYVLKLKGYDKLTIPGGNKLLESVANNHDQLNTPYTQSIMYGENIGIMLDAERQIYDLNTADYLYYQEVNEGPSYQYKTLNSPLRDSISYEKVVYNYNINDEVTNKFVSVYDEPVKLQYYFPYLGQIPKMLERLAVIDSNANNPETNCTMNNNCKSSVYGLSTSKETTDNVNGADVKGLFGWNSNISDSVKDPQLFYCSDLPEEKKGIDDCYLKPGEDRSQDPIKQYLCSVNLDTGCSCIEDDSDIIPATGDMGSIAGKVAWPIDNSKKYVNTTTSEHYMGFDIASYGQEIDVYAAADGKVIFLRDQADVNCYSNKQLCPQNFTDKTDSFNAWSPYYGNTIGILHKDGVSVYAHLTFNSTLVKEGDYVKAGQMIAKVGSTGNSSGHHLHFELRKLNCISYNASCTLHSHTTPFEELFIEVAHNATSTQKTSSTSVSSRTYCNANSSPVNNDPVASIECLINKAVNFLNNSWGGYYTTPEVVYAVLKGESSFLCENYGGKVCDSGDPNQISKLVPYACLSNPSSCAGASDDGVGISQFTSGSFNSQLRPYESDMLACMDAIGVNYQNPNPEADDPGIYSTIFNRSMSRKRIGDSICAVAITLMKKGKAIGFTEADKADVEKNMIEAEYYTCPAESVWCKRADQNYRPNLVDAIDNKIMDSCSSSEIKKTTL